MKKVLAVLVAASVGALAVGCAETQTGSIAPKATPKAHVSERGGARDTWPKTPAPEPAPVAAKPDGKFSSSCDLLLNIDSPSHLVAQTKLRNTGNVGIVVKATAVFEQVGTSPLKLSKIVRVTRGHSRRVNFDTEVSSEQIDRYQAAYGQGDECRVRVSIIDSFGEAV